MDKTISSGLNSSYSTAEKNYKRVAQSEARSKRDPLINKDRASNIIETGSKLANNLGAGSVKAVSRSKVGKKFIRNLNKIDKKGKGLDADIIHGVKNLAVKGANKLNESEGGKQILGAVQSFTRNAGLNGVSKSIKSGLKAGKVSETEVNLISYSEPSKPNNDPTKYLKANVNKYLDIAENYTKSKSFKKDLNTGSKLAGKAIKTKTDEFLKSNGLN